MVQVEMIESLRKLKTQAREFRRRTALRFGLPVDLSQVRLNRRNLLPTDKILLSYPRSGNTWTRYLVADLILQHYGFDTSLELPINHYNLIPSIHSQDISTAIDDQAQLSYRLIKSHHNHDADGRDTIYVFRQPMDVLCSYYYFVKAKQDFKEEAKLMSLFIEDDMSLDEFCLKNVDRWKRHLEQVLARHEKGESIAWICYEQLHLNPQPTLQSIVRFLGLNESSIDLDKAVKNHSFENRVSSLAKQGAESERVFNFRKGKVGSSVEELKVETQQVIDTKTRALYDEARSLCPQDIGTNHFAADS